MKLWISCLLLIALVSILVPNESEAWRIRIRFRRIVRRIGHAIRKVGDTVKKVGCRVACAKQCHGLLCSGICVACYGRRRRDADGTQTEGLIPEPGFTIIPLPRDFKAYDQEPRDGFIVYDPEFVVGAGLVMVMDDDATREMFDSADTDKDGRISRAEFSKAPWMFEDEDDVDDEDDGGDEGGDE